MIIAGLGNPGPEYERTRHNIGFWAADVLAKSFKVKFERHAHLAMAVRFSFKGNSHFLLKPQTYMNLSGESIRSFLSAEKAEASDLMVLADDVNLQVGRVRLRQAGSSGGHNGLKSVIGYLGENFWRLRIGVGRPAEGTMVNHVLGEVSPEEMRILDKVLEDIPGLVICVIMGKGGHAMSRFNCRDYSISP